MTTDAQRQANALNALASTGPRTEEGLARSAQNALQHGLYATTMGAIVSGSLKEDPDDIAALEEAVFSWLAPETVWERVAAAHITRLLLRDWRMSRLEVLALGQSNDLDRMLKLEDVVSRVDARTGRELRAALADYRDGRDRRAASIGHEISRAFSGLFEANQRDADQRDADQGDLTTSRAGRKPLLAVEWPPREQPVFLCLTELLEMEENG